MRHCTGCSDNKKKTDIRHPNKRPGHPPASKQRRWLILAHCFNMDGRAASQTITDRIPFILEQQIEPVVLSAPTGNRDRRFPHHQIFSASPSCFLFEIRQIINQKTSSHLWRHILKTALTLTLLPFYILEKIFVHLDSHWSWAISATYSGRQLIRKYRPELIYSSGGASSAHLAGFLLHRISGLPWLAELHDPLCYTHQPPRGQNRRFHCWLEKIIAQHADAIIFFTKQAKDHAIKRHPAMNGKASILRPGANPPDFSEVTYLKSDKLNIGHFGSLAPTRNLTTVFKALALTLKNNPEWRDLIRLHIYGSELDPLSAAAMMTSRLDDIIIQHGRLEYDSRSGKSGRQQIMEAMRRSDILLLLHGSNSSTLEYIPSKLYEYLLVKRPILGLTDPDSELGKILRDSGHLTIDADNHHSVEAALIRIIKQWQLGGLPDQQSALSFTVCDATGQLIQIVEQILIQRQNNKPIPIVFS